MTKDNKSQTILRMLLGVAMQYFQNPLPANVSPDRKVTSPSPAFWPEGADVLRLALPPRPPVAFKSAPSTHSGQSLTDAPAHSDHALGNGARRGEDGTMELHCSASELIAETALLGSIRRARLVLGCGGGGAPPFESSESVRLQAGSVSARVPSFTKRTGVAVSGEAAATDSHCPGSQAGTHDEIGLPPSLRAAVKAALLLLLRYPTASRSSPRPLRSTSVSGSRPCRTLSFACSMRSLLNSFRTFAYSALRHASSSSNDISGISRYAEVPNRHAAPCRRGGRGKSGPNGGCPTEKPMQGSAARRPKAA
mmetsp:Transcript_19483/g.56638  ORF Transcript_19483/g.56638 Transcript_19483/m.56638 type:complete len:309 (-) Transcript_19483:35-961(-)